MKLKTKTEKFILDKEVVTMKHTHKLEQDIIVPDTSPDIIKIINIEAKSRVMDIIKQKKIITVQGIIHYNIIYKTADNIGSYRTISTKVPYRVDINIDKDIDNVNFFVNSVIESLTYSIPNERKIAVKTEVAFRIHGFSEIAENIITGMEDKAKIERILKKKELKNKIETKQNNIIAKEEISLKEGMPKIAGIISTTAKVANVDYKVSYNKLIVKADVVGKIVYISENNNINEIPYKIPVTGFIEFSNALDNSDINLNMKLQNIEFNVNQSTKNAIVADIIILARANIERKREVEYVEDMYFLDLEVIDELPSDNIQMRDKTNMLTVNIEERLNNYIKKNDEILGVFLEASKLNVKDIDNEKYLEGNISLNAIVLNGKDINSKKIDIPVKEKLENVGIIKDLEYEIENINFSVQNDNLIVNLKILLNIVEVIDIKALVGEEIEVEDLNKNKYKSVIIYNTQKGDNLWKIAKKYKTTVDNIVKINDIQDKNKIAVNQKLLIIR